MAKPHGESVNPAKGANPGKPKNTASKLAPKNKTAPPAAETAVKRLPDAASLPSNRALFLPKP
jgi:hypothetical protein